MTGSLRAGVIAGCLFLAFNPAAAGTDASSASLPLTTKSRKARRLMDEAWVLAVDQVEQAKAIVVLQKTVKADPNFALAHQVLAQTSLDPAEQVSEQARAFETRRHASTGEQTIIQWFQDAADHKLISAITNMNEVLNKYPHDRWVVYLANNWLTVQTQYERAAKVYENSGISDSPGLINNTAYTYAFMRQFDRAFTLMDKYVASLPKEPNPQDSYAEILRMAGHFDEAIDHYKAALVIDRNFYSADFGIADTYLLMGDEVHAREQYEAAFHRFSIPELHRIQWKTREALTYVRDGNLKGADAAFQAIADYAHAKQMSQVEADTYRQMAIYQPLAKQASAYLLQAEGALREHKNVMPMAVQQERAQILRARVEAALKSGDQKAADATLTKLADLAEISDDRVIDTAYHGALGAHLYHGHHYADAILHLEEDTNNPLSLKLLALIYEKTGDTRDAKRVSETLANLNDPTLEQVLTVPAFRKCLLNSGCEASMKNAAFRRAPGR